MQFSRTGVGCVDGRTLSALYFHVARPTRRLYRLLHNLPDHLRDADRACGQCRRLHGHFVRCKRTAAHPASNRICSAHTHSTTPFRCRTRTRHLCCRPLPWFQQQAPPLSSKRCAGARQRTPQRAPASCETAHHHRVRTRSTMHVPPNGARHHEVVATTAVGASAAHTAHNGCSARNRKTDVVATRRARGATTATQRHLRTRAFHQRITTTSDDVIQHRTRRCSAGSPHTRRRRNLHSSQHRSPRRRPHRRRAAPASHRAPHRTQPLLWTRQRTKRNDDTTPPRCTRAAAARAKHHPQRLTPKSSFPLSSESSFPLSI